VKMILPVSGNYPNLNLNTTFKIQHVLLSFFPDTYHFCVKGQPKRSLVFQKKKIITFSKRSKVDKKLNRILFIIKYI